MLFDTFDRTGNAEFSFHKQVVFRALCMAVEELDGMTIDSRDDLASRLDVKTGMSLFSWGERVTISVTGSGENSAVVSIQSGAKTILGSATTHGKNRKNIRDVITHTSKLLAQYGSKWEEEMDLKRKVQDSASLEKSPGSVADELTKLAALKEQGILSAEEFNAQKARLLGN